MKPEPNAPPLIGGNIECWEHIAVDIIRIAAIDEYMKRDRRTGDDIMRLVTNDGRAKHRRLCSTIYNQFRDELAIAPRRLF